MTRGTKDSPLEQARRLASLFCLPGPIEVRDFPEKGNINQDTYLIAAGPAGSRSEYLLQLLNRGVFTQPRAVMNAMVACIQAQQEALARGILRKGEEWETITLIPTLEGMPYLEIADDNGCSCWRMMAKIPCTRSYKSLSEIGDLRERVRVAEEAGSGLALFGALTSGTDVSQLAISLPGYRDTRVYYDQFLSVLAGNRTIEAAAPYLPSDPIVQQSTARHFLIHLPPEEYHRRLEDPELRRFIALARTQEHFGLMLIRELHMGKLRRVVIHGDTKLSNFLFSTLTGKTRSLVDLDTIMPHTWLADWGDMVRSLVNVAGEKELDLEKVRVDLEIFQAVARGFLCAARNIAAHEIELMVDAAQIMTLELGVRFLADYLRGDSYFQPSPSDPWDINKIRAIVQLSLFEKLTQKEDAARRCVMEARAEAQGRGE